MKKILIVMALLLFVTPVMSQEKVVNMKPKTPAEWRTYLNFRRDETLNSLYDNKTGEDIFMRMVRAHAGFGVGIKDFRAVFTLDDRAAMESFIDSGWSFGTEANVAVKGFDSGAAKSGAIRVAPGIRVYQLTENGLAAEVNLTGTKYWKDKRTNIK